MLRAALLIVKKVELGLLVSFKLLKKVESALRLTNR